MAAIARAVSKRIASLAVSSAPKNVSGAKGMHSTAPKQMSGSHDDHSHSYDDYLHAKHMYNLPAMKHRKLKIGLGVFGVVAVGTAVPVIAVLFQQKKSMII